MAKRRKKQKVEKVVAEPPKPVETQYYWCVNCGHHGDYGSIRKRGLKCELCDYDEITPYDLEEINDPFMDNVWLERFRTKAQVDKGIPKETPAERDARTESKTKSIKTETKSVKDRIAEIRGQNDNKREKTI